MGMRGNNFQHKVLAGVALVPQSVGQATVNGATISEPWKKAKQISFILIGGVFGTAVAATCKVQGLRRSDGTTWDNLKQWDTTTDLGFTASKLADAAELENGYLLGTLDLTQLDGVTYKALRLQYIQATGSVTALMGAAFVLSDLYVEPGGQADDLFSKMQSTAS
jgi:hypothetical protein